jgi:hypothetical protein
MNDGTLEDLPYITLAKSKIYNGIVEQREQRPCSAPIKREPCIWVHVWKFEKKVSNVHPLNTTYSLFLTELSVGHQVQHSTECVSLLHSDSLVRVGKMNLVLTFRLDRF